MRRTLRATVWFGAYIAVIVLPLAFAAIGVVEDRRGFWTEFSVALGFVGLAMMGLQFVLVARFQTLARPFGEDALVHFHRYVGVAGTAFIFAHPVLLIVLVDPTYIERVNPFTAPWAGRFGTLAVVCLLVVIATSVWRLKLRISYEVWQALHLVLSTVAVVAALVHVQLIHHYVDLPWKRALWVLMSAGFLVLFLWVRVLRPVLRTRRPWRVAEVKDQPGDVTAVTLQPVGHSGFSFAPGQFGWLSVDRSPFAVTQHPFSFSSNGDDPSRVEVSIKKLGDFTSTIGSVRPGTVAYLDGPHGVFSPDFHEGPGLVLIAGGVGIGPIMSILRTLAARGDSRPCHLFYGSRRLEDATYRDEIRDLSRTLTLEVHAVLSDPEDTWAGERGYVDEEKLHRLLPRDTYPTYQYFICGPGAMQDAMEDALGRLGVPADRVHTERFNFV